MPEFNGDNAYRILESIAHERLAATKGERTAAETLADSLRGAGLEPALEEFRMWTYINDDARIEVLDPYQAVYKGAVIGLSGNTPEGGLECGFKYIEDGSSQYLTDIAGKAVLTSGPLSYEKVRELRDKNAAAIITTTTPHRLPNRKPWSEQMRMRVGKLPSLTLAFDDALELVKKQAGRLRLHVTQEEIEGVSQNVVAEIPGTEFPDEIIVLTAHYDGISKCIAGHDNASGTAVMAELGRVLATEKLKRTVRVVLTGGEEYGLFGSWAYVNAHKAEMDNVRLCINCDITGVIIGTNNCFVTGPDSMRWYLEAMGREFGMGYTVSTAAYSSDNVPFSAMGVPATSITRGGGYCCEIHSSGDELQDMDGPHLAITGQYILEFLRRVGNAVVFPFKREIADEAKKQVDKYVERSRGLHYKPIKKLTKK